MVPQPNTHSVRAQPIRVPIRNPAAPWIITHHVLVNPVTRKVIR